MIDSRYIQQDLDRCGGAILNDGFNLETAESLISEQRDWSDTDPFKTFDYTKFPYWLTTSRGTCITGVNSIDEAIEIAEEKQRRLSS